MFRHLGLGIVLLLGCGDDGPSGTSVDAGGDARGADADPSCYQWRRVPVDVTEVVSLENAPIHPERTARFLVDVQQCPGDLPAVPEVGFTLENEFVALRMSVWRSAPDCAQPTTVQRPVSIRFLYAGGWKFVLANSDQRTFTVVAAPGTACNPNAACDQDCDCATGVCMSGYGLAGPFTQCAVPCELDRDCGGTGVCVPQIADGLSYSCTTGATECEAIYKPCPQGFECNGNGACEPTFTLSGATRHECTCDAECGGGLRCAFHEGAATGQCESLCLTDSAGWCEGPHVCVGSIEPPYGVCGWIGD